MKKKYSLIIGCLILFISCDRNHPIVTDFKVIFSPPGSNQVIVRTEGKEKEIPSIESVTLKLADQVKRITTLEIVNVGLVSVSSVGKFDSLENLEFGRNKITTIDGITFPQRLTRIAGEENKIVSLEFIRDLKKLRSIIFYNNQISGFPKNIDLPSLEDINLSGNLIENLESFNSLKALRKLTISKNRLKNIGILPSGLEYLKAEENPITDISGIQGEKIFFLNLSKSKLTKIPSLKGLPNMKEIFFDGTPSIQDYSGLSDLKELVVLHLEDCGLEDVNKLPLMPSVRGLYLTKNRIIEIPPILEKFPSLAVLYLDGNQIEKVSGMKRFFEGSFQNWSLKDNPVKSIVKEDWETYLKSLNGQESEISQAVKEGKIQVVEN